MAGRGSKFADLGRAGLSVDANEWIGEEPQSLREEPEEDDEDEEEDDESEEDDDDGNSDGYSE